MSLLIVLASTGVLTASVTAITALGIRYARRVLESEEKARVEEIALEREILALERVKYETENYEVLATVRKQEAKAEKERAPKEKEAENDRLVSLPILLSDDGKAISHCHYCDCEVKGKDSRWLYSKWREERERGDAAYVQELAKGDDALGPTFGVSVRLNTSTRRYDGQQAILQACTRCQQEWVLFMRNTEERAEARSRK